MKNFAVALGDDGADAPALEGLRGVLAAGAAAKVLVGDKDSAVSESGVGEGMGFILGGEAFDVVSKGVLANAVEGDALEEPRGDDAVGVDVVAAQRDAGAGDLADDFACHVSSPNVRARR